MKDGEKIAQQLIYSKIIPDAIFAANAPLAIGAMRILKQNRYNVPEDIAFIRFSESKFPRNNRTSINFSCSTYQRN